MNVVLLVLNGLTTTDTENKLLNPPNMLLASIIGD